MRLLVIFSLSLASAACTALQVSAPNPPGFVLGETPPGGKNGKIEEPCVTASELAELRQIKPSPQKFVQQAMNHLRDNQLGLALTEIDKALVANPKDVQALNVAGLIYERMGDTQSALVHLGNAVFAAPDDPYTRNNYGTLLCRLGQQREAITQFERIAKAPNYETPEVAYTNAGLCARTIPDTGLAAQFFNQALQINPKSPTALYQVAKLSYERGNYLGARDDLQHYLQIAPHTSKTLLLRVDIERALGNTPAADAYTQQLLKLFPSSEEALQAQGRAHTPARPAAPKPAQTEAPLAGSAVVPTPIPATEVPTRVAPPEKSVTAAPAKTSVSVAPASVRREDWLLGRTPGDYTIQILADTNERAVTEFLERHKLGEEAAYFAFRQGDTTWYSLLYSSFSSLKDAEAAIASLPAALAEQQPWVRRYSQIQKLIAQNQGSTESPVQ